MNNDIKIHFPTIKSAIHLIVLYIFIQTLVDFPLAIIDYYNGTDYLYNPIKKIVLGLGSGIFIFYYAYRKANVPLNVLFPVKKFNLLILLPITAFLWAAHNLIGEINSAVDRIIPPPAWFWELFNKVFESDYGIYGAILKVAIIAPVVEELIFRGVIMHGLIRNYKKYTAVIISALLFALFHLNPWQFPATFILGIVLGIIMLRTRNIFLCVLGHSINNGLVLFSIEYWEQLKETSFFMLTKPNQLIISFVIASISLLLIFVLSRSKKNETI